MDERVCENSNTPNEEGMIDSRTSYLQDLGRRLASGWSPGHETAVGDLAHAFTRAFHTDTAVVQIGVNEAVLRFSLEDIRLRNFDNVYAVAVGGDVPDRELLNSLKSRFKGDDRVLLILAPTLAWQKDLDSVFPGRLGFMAACLPDFVSLLSEQDSKEQLKRFALDRVSRYALNPFNVLKVPAQNMFYGRSHQIEMLLQTPDTSWAIAGPGPKPGLHRLLLLGRLRRIHN
jgi:hypothetical protein